MSKNLNRRAVLVGTAAVPLASATALADTNGASDAELRRLWSEYLKQSAAFDAASEKMKPARAVRCRAPALPR